MQLTKQYTITSLIRAFLKWFLLSVTILCYSEIEAQNYTYDYYVETFRAYETDCTSDAGQEEYRWYAYEKGAGGGSDCTGCNDDGGGCSKTAKWLRKQGNSYDGKPTNTYEIHAWEEDGDDGFCGGSATDYDGDDCHLIVDTNLAPDSKINEYETTYVSKTYTGANFGFTTKYAQRYITYDVEDMLDVDNIVTGGDRPFWGTNGEWCGTCAASGTINAGQISWLKTTVSCMSSFAYTIESSSKSNVDYFQLFVDGVEIEKISGQNRVSGHPSLDTSKDHEIEFRFTRAAGSTGGNDNRALIEYLEFFDATIPTPTDEYGSQRWNATVYEGQDLDLGGGYKGWFPHYGLDIISTDYYDDGDTPSNALDYRGCAVTANDHTLVYKREGFACGQYQIDIGDHDDEIRVYVDNAEVFEYMECCESHTNVWSGELNEDSRFEIRQAEGVGASLTKVYFTKLFDCDDEFSFNHLPDDETCGHVISFDGVDDYFNIDAIANNVSDDNLTFEAWFNTSASGQQTILGVNTADQNSNIFIIFLKDGKMSVYDGAESQFEITGHLDYNDGEWHYLVYTKEAGIGKLYVDLEYLGSHDADYTISSTDHWSLGQEFDNGSTSDHYQGLMDRVNIWSETWDHSYVLSYYLDPWDGDEDNLVAAYTCNHPYLNTDDAVLLEDLSLNNNGFSVGVSGFDAYKYLDGTQYEKDSLYIENRLAFGENIMIGDLEISDFGHQEYTIPSHRSCDSTIVSQILGLPYNETSCANQLNFDGVDDYVNISSVASDMAFSDFTVSAWINSTSDQSGTILAANTAEGGNEFIIEYFEGSTIRVYDGEDSQHEAFYYTEVDGEQINPYINDGEWHHIVYTKIGSTGALYVNGKYIDDHEANYVIILSAQWSLGQEFDGGSTSGHYQGSMDNVTLWSHGVNKEGVNQLMNADIVGNEEGLVAAYNFNASAGSSQLSDLSPSHYDGSLVNMQMSNAWTNTMGEVCLADPLLSIEEIGALNYGDLVEIVTTASNEFEELTIVLESSDESVLSLSGNMVTAIGIGEVTITATIEESDNYKAAEKSIEVEVTKTPLTISHADILITYGQLVSSFTPIYSGFKFEEQSDVIDVLPNWDLLADVYYDADLYDIVLSNGEDDHYSFIYDDQAQLTVQKAALEITADDLTKVYEEVNPEATFTYEGFVLEEDSSDLDAIPEVFIDADIYSFPDSYYLIEIISFDDNNYEIDFVNGELFVQKADQTIELPTIDFIYLDESPFELTATASSDYQVTYDIIEGDGVIEGNILTINSAGDFVIEVSEPGSYYYNPAPTVQLIFEVRVKQPPIISEISDLNTNEEEMLSFSVSATDIDSEILVFSIDEVSIASGMSIDESSGEFEWTPTESQDGDHKVSITVSDGELEDVETFTITVDEVNEAPIMSTIDDQSVDELVQLSFTANATDQDNTNQSLTYELDETSIASGMSIDASSGEFEWTATESQDGEHEVSITVSDGELEDVESFIITVNEVNEAPIMSTIDDQSVDELVQLSFTAHVTDNDNTDQSLTYELDEVSIASGMSIDESSGEFEWTATESQDGDHEVSITVSDGELEDVETFTITVDEVNEAPIMSTIDDQSVDELIQLSFTANATDQDNTNQSLTYELDETSIASGMSIDASSGKFEWTATESQDGEHEVSITVSDGELEDVETFTITVDEVNEAPIMSTIDDQSVDELVQLSFTAHATDNDNTDQSLTYELDEVSIASGMSIDASSGEFEWTATESQDGDHEVSITVSDGELEDVESFIITVNEVNEAPVFASISDQSVNELVELTFTVSASDIDDNAELTFALDEPSLSSGMSIDPATGVFTWTPSESQDGVHEVTVSVSDGELEDSQSVTITVNEVGEIVNLAPELAILSDQSTDESTMLTFTVTATDLDSETLNYSLDAASIDKGMSIDPATGVFSWTPSESQDGEHSVTVAVSDGELEDSQSVTITVNEVGETVNLAPELAILSDQSTDEGTLLTFTVTATDLDSETLTYSLDAASIDKNMSIDKATGVFAWIPSESQDGEHTVTVSVSDGELEDSQSITITVNEVAEEVNVAPELAILSDQSTDEGTMLTFTVTATDPESETLTYSLDAASIDKDMSIDAATGVFIWTPSESQDGEHSVTVSVSDGELEESQSITITVNEVAEEVNVAPELAILSDQSTDEGTFLTFTVTATDPDSETLTYTLDAAPIDKGMSIDATTGVFIWTPSESQDGEHSVTVSVSDGELEDSQSVSITVNEVAVEVNVSPELAIISNQSTDEGTFLTFTVTATDPDSETLTYSLDAASIDKDMSIDATTGVFSWTPSESQDGEHSVTVAVSDGELEDSQSVTITVNEVAVEVNVSPELAIISNQSTDEGTFLTFTVTATDPESETLTYSLDAASIDKGMSIDAATGVFSWTPSESQDGEHSVTVSVSDGELEDSQSITITVNEVADKILEVKETSTQITSFPNPANHFLHLVLEEGQGSMKCSVFTINGYLILRVDIDQKNAEIDVSGIPNGMYLMVITKSDGKIETRKSIMIRH